MAIRYLSGINVDSNTLFVDSTNNRVGIGTGSPVSSLNINNGDAWINVTDTLRGLQFGYAGPSHGSYRAAVMGGAESYGGTDSGMLTFHTQNGYVVSAIPPERMRITSAGNVGIGTTSPAAKLQVGNGTSNSPSSVAVLSADGGNAVLNALSLVNSRSAANGNGTSINFHNANNYGPTGRITSVQDSGTNASLRFSVYNSTDDALVERITLLSSGNVGIGTTNPLSLLHVYGSNPRNLIQDAGAGYPYIQLNNSSGNFYFAIDNSAGSGFGSAYARYIYSEGAYPIILVTNSAEAMRITSAGNVGIGTTTVTFDTGSGLRIERSGASTIRLAGEGAAAEMSMTSSGYQIDSRNGYIRFITGAASGVAIERMRITADGNVGIGTTSPSTKLHVFTTSNSDQELLRLTVAPADSSGAKPKAILGFYTPAEANTQDYTSGRITSKFDVAGYANSRVTIESLDSGGNFIETLTAKNGNVGIGTTSPAKILDINIPAASHANYGIRLNSAVGYGGASLYHDYGQGNGVTVFKITNDYGDARINLTQDGYDASGSPSSIRFFTAPQGGGDTGLERVRIASTGNVGIGTTSPSTKLDVIGVGAFGTMTSSRGTYSNGLSLQNNTGEATSLFLWQSGVASAHIGSPANSTSLHIVNSYNTGLITDPNSIVLTNTGNVGIGTTSPGAKLEIAQNTDNTDGPTLRIANNANTLSNGQLIGAIDFYNGDDSGTGNAVGAFIRSFTADAVLPVSSQYLSFAAGGTTERMRIASTGATRLNAYGSGSFTGTVAYNLAVDSSGNIIETAGGVVDGSGTANYVSKWSDANTLTNSVIYENGGNIGIGVTDADYPLTVGSINVGGAGANLGIIINSVINTAIPSSSVKAIIGVTNSGFGYSAGSLLLQPRTGVNGVVAIATEGTEKFRVNQDGNVGIGTTSPSQKLEVAGALVVGMTVPAPFWNAQFKDFSDGSGIYISSVNGGGGKYIAGNAYYYNSLLWRSDKTVASAINLDNGTVVFYTNSGLTANTDFTPTERMRITSDGSVGIGTTSPIYKLDVSGTARIYGDALFLDFTNASGGLRWRVAPYIGGVANAGFELYDVTNGAARFVINGTGNVGIGNTAPSQKLHVSGNLRVTGAYYDSNNSAGSSGQVLSSTGSGTAWVNQGEAVASSLFDLLPNARVTYDWTVQLTAGTWADIFSSNTVLSNGTWMVQVYVDDFAVGGQQYQETYSGVMSWGSASSTNETGPEAISEIVLHRSGHAANSGNFYLRTVERVTSTLLLQGMSNLSHTAATTINFKFVKIF